MYYFKPFTRTQSQTICAYTRRHNTTILGIHWIIIIPVNIQYCWSQYSGSYSLQKKIKMDCCIHWTRAYCISTCHEYTWELFISYRHQYIFVQAHYTSDSHKIPKSVWLNKFVVYANVCHSYAMYVYYILITLYVYIISLCECGCLRFMLKIYSRNIPMIRTLSIHRCVRLRSRLKEKKQKLTITNQNQMILHQQTSNT